MQAVEQRPDATVAEPSKAPVGRLDEPTSAHASHPADPIPCPLDRLHPWFSQTDAPPSSPRTSSRASGPTTSSVSSFASPLSPPPDAPRSGSRRPRPAPSSQPAMPSPRCPSCGQASAPCPIPHRPRARSLCAARAINSNAAVGALFNASAPSIDRDLRCGPRALVPTWSGFSPPNASARWPHASTVPPSPRTQPTALPGRRQPSVRPRDRRLLLQAQSALHCRCRPWRRDRPAVTVGPPGSFPPRPRGTLPPTGDSARSGRPSPTCRVIGAQ